MPDVYFNEIDGFYNQWIFNAFGVRPEERSIVDIQEPSNFKRQHYFAGLGGWEWALRLAGWPSDREVWTGSCPCQPFSVAGKRKGTTDERHLWPDFLRLITIGRPATILGEQVASKDGRIWLAGVRADLEALGYAVGAADLCAASVGAPHIRQRLYWVAVALHPERGTVGVDGGDGRDGQDGGREEAHGEPRARGEVRGMEFPPRNGRQQGRTESIGGSAESRRATDGLGDSDLTRSERRGERLEQCTDQLSAWAASTTIYCSDGRWRRIPLEPGFQPLADDGRFGNPRTNSKLSSRIGALKAAGNAICVSLAAEFIKAVMECSYGQPV